MNIILEFFLAFSDMIMLLWRHEGNPTSKNSTETISKCYLGQLLMSIEKKTNEQNPKYLVLFIQ